MAKKSKIAKAKKNNLRYEVLLRNGNPNADRASTRHENRDKLTGRPRGYMRFFGISRLTFRELALKGELPGVVKASK